MSLSSIKKKRSEAEEKETAEKDSPMRTEQREEAGENPQLHLIEELSNPQDAHKGQLKNLHPFLRKRKSKESNPLTSLFTKSYKFLTKSQIEEQTRRFQQHQRKRRGEIKQKTEELDQLEQVNIKKAPTLSEHTLEICRAVPNDPIYLRYERELQRSKQELQAKVEQAEKVRQELQQKQLDEMEDYNKKISLKKSRTADEFFEEALRWKRRREQNLEAKREQRQQLEIKDLTLQPKIGDRTRRMKKPPRSYLQPRDPRSQCQRFTEHHATQKRY